MTHTAKAQYSMDGGVTWQDSATFTGLKSTTEYSFVARYGATDNYFASPVSAELKVTTSAAPSSGGIPYPPTVEQPDEGGTVTVSPKNPMHGSKVTVTPEPDDGYEVDSVTVTDRNGNAVEVKDNGDGTYTFVQPAGKVTVTVCFQEIAEPEPEPEPEPDIPCDGGDSCPTHTYTDLDSSAWYHEAVDFVLENGLMSGYGDGTFGPNDTLSRAMLAQILYNREEQPAISGSSDFTDVADGAWYTDAIIWASANGIVGGYGDGTFGPNDFITREQLAVMLWRYAGSPTSSHSLDGFTDADQISSWALDAMLWATENGIINGYDGILNPACNATRAEAAQMLKNFMDNRNQE